MCYKNHDLKIGQNNHNYDYYLPYQAAPVFTALSNYKVAYFCSIVTRQVAVLLLFH